MKRSAILFTLMASTTLVVVAACGRPPQNVVNVAPAPTPQVITPAPAAPPPPAPPAPMATRERTVTREEVIRPGSSSVTTHEMVVSQAPPPPRQEVMTMAPSPAHIWVPGYWTWNNGWQWVSGHWELPPQRMTVWVPGRWVQDGANWLWRPGHWQ